MKPSDLLYNNVLLYKRYVDAVFYLFETGTAVEKSYKFINFQHPNIKFTSEKKKTFPFLNVLVKTIN